MRMPMWDQLGVRQQITSRPTWIGISDRVSACSFRLLIEKWKRSERVVVFRKRISGRPARAFQPDLFQPDDGYYEYSMVVTNKTESDRTMWDFIA